MADELKMIEFSRGGRPMDVFDLERVVGGVAGDVVKMKNSFKITPPAATNAEASGSRRWDGTKVVGQKHGNGSVSARWQVRGATAQAALDNVAVFLEQVRSTRPCRFIKWRAEQEPYPTYYEVRGPGEWVPDYSKVVFDQGFSVFVDATWPVAPLALQDRMDVFDDFSVDSIGDYTFDAGGGTLAVAGGQLVPSTNAAKRFYHSARGYRYSDAQVTFKFTPGTQAGGEAVGVYLRRLDANNYLFAQVVGNNALTIQKQDGGVPTGLATTAIGSFTSGSPHWIRLRAEGNVLTAEFWTSKPTPMGAPAVTLTHQLSTADAVKFGNGVVGQAGAIIAGGPAPAVDWRYGDFEVLPYTYRNRTLPELVTIGDIPGDEDAPALVDVNVTTFGGATAAVWALLGWNKRQPWNRVWNGHFEVDTAGWATTVDNFLVAGATATRVTTASKFGTAAMQVVTAATAGQGARFVAYGRFRRGVTYTLSLWIMSAAQTTSVKLAAGKPDWTNIASNDANLSAVWTQRTLTFTPDADYDEYRFGVKTNAATATTFLVDGVQVYEGTVAPTLDTQTEGRGAVPPFGVIPAASVSSVTGWAITADANYHGGQGLKVTTAGAGSGTATWLMDPSALEADDFSGEIEVEFFARVELATGLVSPKLTLTTLGPGGASFGVQRTANDLPLGKLLTKPSAGTVFRRVRIGTLTFNVDRRRPSPMAVTLAGSWALGSTGTFGVDELIAVPLAKRAVSGPTGKVLDTSYPKFTRTTSQVTRIMRSDGSGWSYAPGGVASNPTQDVGMSRTIEMDSGSTDVLLALSSLVPDDPTSDATNEQKDYSATVHFDVWPRVALARGS